MNIDTAQLPEGIPPLTTYYMYLTGGCNLACRHCWITPTFEQDGGVGQCLDYDLYKLAIEEALPLGLSGIKFTGGEPLLHPNFVQMAEYATQKGLGCWLETNGTLVTRDLAFHLKEKTSIFSVSVSIDGETEETHDFMRNMVGSHKQAQRGVSNLVEAGYKVQIIMSLFEGNVEEIEPLVRWAVQSGCGSVKFNIIQPSGRALQMRRKDNLLTIEKLVQLGSWVEKELQPSVSIPLYYSWPMAFQGFKQLRHSLQGASCDIHSILGVLSTGHLSMCGIGVQESDLVYGQLGVDQVKEIWTTNPVLSNLREAVPTKLEGVCGQCFFKNRCVGSCIAQNYFTTKKLTAPFWFCHDAIENDLFPKSRLQQLDESLPAEISKITGE